MSLWVSLRREDESSCEWAVVFPQYTVAFAHSEDSWDGEVAAWDMRWLQGPEEEHW